MFKKKTLFTELMKADIRKQLEEVFEKDRGVVFIMRLDDNGKVIEDCTNLIAHCKESHAVLAADQLLHHISDEKRPIALLKLLGHRHDRA